MHIALVIDSLECGGAERIAAILANAWNNRGHCITLITFAPIESDFYSLNNSIQRISIGAAHTSIGSLQTLLKNAARIRKLHNLLQQHSFDLAISFMPTANVVLALASAGINNLTTIGTEHTHPPLIDLGRAREWLRKFCYHRLSTVTALTPLSANWLQHHTQVKKVQILPNPVCWPLHSTEPCLMPYSITANYSHVLLAAGRLVQEKGFDDLIRAFALIQARHPDWCLVILGEGPLRPQLENKITSVDLQQRIFLPGRVGNLGDWYNHASLFAMTSHREGFPNVLLEAMSYGVAAISYDCDTGPRDIIRNGIDGILVAEGNIEAFSMQLSQLMNDKDERIRMGKNAIDVRERFSIEVILALWQALFVELDLVPTDTARFQET